MISAKLVANIQFVFDCFETHALLFVSECTYLWSDKVSPLRPLVCADALLQLVVGPPAFPSRAGATYAMPRRAYETH
jgi:hypothetical protein